VTREAWWFGLAPLAEALEPELVRLFDARNTLAGAFGYTMYPELAFEAGELSRIEFMSTCDEIEQLTRPIYEQFLAWCREQLDGLPLEPWDLDFLLTRLEPADANAADADIPSTVATRMAAWGATLAPTMLVEAVMNPAALALAWGAGLACCWAAARAGRLEAPCARRATPVPPATAGATSVALGSPGDGADDGPPGRAAEPPARKPEDERARAWRGWRDVTRLRDASATASSRCWPTNSRIPTCMASTPKSRSTTSATRATPSGSGPRSRRSPRGPGISPR
jgi:hypothetical protein